MHIVDSWWIILAAGSKAGHVTLLTVEANQHARFRRLHDCIKRVHKQVDQNLLQSVRLLADTCESFNDHCAQGLEPHRENLEKNLQNSLMLVTALAPEIGYDKATEIAKTAHKNGTTLREEALRLGYVSEEEFDRFVRPQDMIGPSGSGPDPNTKKR